MNIINLAYDSTNYNLVQSNCGWIMIDTGWAGTFKEIDKSNTVVVSSSDSRKLLKTIGIEGELIPTPGHGDPFSF